MRINEVIAPSRKNDGSSPRISIFGAYGGVNLGDEAILAGILQMLGEVGIGREHITVGSFYSEETAAQHEVQAVQSVQRFGLTREFRAAISNADALIIGGGQLILESRRIRNPWTSNLARVAMVTRFASEVGTPVFFWGVGVEHVETGLGRRQVQQLSKAAAVTVRDERSARILRAHGISAPHVVGDPASVLLGADRARGRQLLREVNHDFPNVERVVGVCLAVDGPLPVAECRLLVEVIDLLSASGVHTVLFSSEVRRGYDERAAEWIEERVSNPVTVFPNRNLPTTDFLSLLAAFDLVISSRMHPVMLAVCAGVPAIPICRSPKSHSLGERLGLPVVLDAGGISSRELAGSAETILSGDWPAEAIAERVSEYRLSALRARDLFEAQHLSPPTPQENFRTLPPERPAVLPGGTDR